ncbi:MAG: hypothetical protein ACLFUP_07545 [Desulfobacteraceae bacterium]
MNEKSSKQPNSAPDDPPLCMISVDKEGRMWHLGAEMTNEGINRLLMGQVELDSLGRYIITLGGERCVVEVEDTFFVITRFDLFPAEGDAPEGAFVHLNDGSREELDPATLRLGPENVLYATVKGGRFPARFLRKSYYQLAGHIIERNGKYVLAYRGQDYPINEA